jgi:superfamily II DNA/RNA helicase
VTHPFPIQELAIPLALLGTDVIGQARTGTGKTFAFGVPLLQRIVVATDPDYAELAAPGRPQALVIVPTRELAVQVTGDLETAGRHRDARLVTVYGGRSYDPQLEALRRGVDVVVGTPGRLLDLAERGKLDLSHVKVLVLDEADEMLDLGFLPDVERLVGMTPELRQTMLFSATLPAEVLSLARRYQRQPVNIRAESPEDSAMVPTTQQHVYRAHALDKPEVLARILQADGRGLTMVFCRTKRTAQQVADDLGSRGFAVAAVHGDLGQGAREQALRAFRNGKVDVLVATDVAARGIDVEGVTHVVNYQCPEDAKVYLHRIGRTGRAGAAGVAVTFVDWDDLLRWKGISTALDLPFDEPPETYSTSQNLHDDLGIPPGATGMLPTASRTRAGLDAETIEDLGERPRGRQRRGPTKPGATAPAEADDRRSDEPARPRRQRSRQRTRSGQPVERAEPTVSAVSAGPADGDPPSADGTKRRRRRTRSRRPLTADAEPAAEPMAP